MSWLWLMLWGACTCNEGRPQDLVARPARDSYGGLPASTARADTLALLGELRELVDLESWDAPARARQVTEAEPEAMLTWLVLAAAAPSREEAAQATARAAALQERGTEAEKKLLTVQQEGDTTGALVAAEWLTLSFPESLESWLVLSRLRTARGETELARRAAQKALEIDAASVSAHALLGESYTFAEPRDLAKAEQHYLETTKLRPRLGAAWINLGDVYRAGKDLDRARDTYAKAVEADPRNPIGPIKRGHVNSFLGNAQEARADYQAGMALGSERDALELGIFHALVSAHEGDPRRALAEMGELLARVDASKLPELEKRAVRQPILQDMLVTALHLGEVDAAAPLLEQLRATLGAEPVTDALLAKTREAELVYWEVRLALARSDLANARISTRRFADKAPEGSPRHAQRHEELLGLVAWKAGEAAAAVEHLRQADLETGVLTRHHLALALEAQGEAEQARALWGQIADWGFNSVDYALVRADARARSEAAL